MTRLASFIISWTIYAAGLICRTSPALSPEGRRISSKSPIVTEGRKWIAEAIAECRTLNAIQI
jgi:hypothetical protein